MEIEPQQRTVRSALDRALLLADAEAAIDGLERWFGTELEVTPDEAGYAAAARRFASHQAMCIGLSPRKSGSLPVSVELPIAALCKLPPPSRTLELSLRLVLPPLAVRCRLTQLTLPASQVDGLVVGAVVLLPESFDAGSWQVQVALGTLMLEATLDPRNSRLRSATSAIQAAKASDAAEDGATIEILLDEPLALDSRVLFGDAAFDIDLPARVPQCRCVCLVDGQPRLAGNVAPLGAGYAFFALENTDRTGAISFTG